MNNGLAQAGCQFNNSHTCYNTYKYLPIYIQDGGKESRESFFWPSNMASDFFYPQNIIKQ